MNTQEKRLIEAGIDLVTWQPAGIWPEPAPDPIMTPYGRPDIPAIFEAYSGPNPSDGVTWTNFQHFKRWMGSFGGSVYVLPYTAAWPNTGGRHWLGRVPPYFGWHNHNGLGPVLQDRSLYVPGQYDGSFIAPPSDLESLRQKGIQNILPGVKTQLSLINSVVELKDFKGLVRKAYSAISDHHRLLAAMRQANKLRDFSNVTGLAIANGIKNYISKFRSEAKSSSPTAAVMRRLSSNFLQWKFAIAPLISDVLAVRKALKSFEKRLNALITNEGKVRVGHWTTTRDELGTQKWETPIYLGPPMFFPISAASTLTSTAAPIRTVFHVELRYNYNFTTFQREHARVLSLLDALGVSVNPAIIWNAIPYTFILDWVLNVSKYLEQFDVGNMTPKINILEALWSIRRTQVFTWEKSHVPPAGISCTERVSMPVVNEEAYRREKFMPGISSIQSSGLNSSEFTLGAALVIARRRRKAVKK